ncbi:RNA-directed DNA polymerase, eukaryota [Tanacetum coccineum]
MAPTVREDVLEDIIRVGHSMGYELKGCMKDIEGLGHKFQKEWNQEAQSKLDMESVCSDSIGSSGGILCVWEKSVFRKENVTVSDNFIAIYGTWISNSLKVLFIIVYAPQQLQAKRLLWDYISSLINSWSGEAIVMGDFNEVRCIDERYGSSFNMLGARRFNEFIKSSGLVDINLEGYKFTWSHPSASKMSKLDRFLAPKFDKRLSADQVMDLDSRVTREEIRRAVWSCGDDKSPGPDGFSFEFFRKYWNFIGPDFCGAVEHFFNKDDAMFIGEWSQANLDNVVKMLQCFQVASGLSINIQKSNLLGVGVRRPVVDQAANKIGCLVMSNRFSYLGVMVGDSMNRRAAWVEVINKLRARLSNWKVKTLSIGGRYTLLKSVLGSSPLYHMSIFKTPKGVLKEMEGIRGKFFNGADPEERKIVWVAWQKVLALRVVSTDQWSFRRNVRDGVERQQWEALLDVLANVSLTPNADRWVCDLTGDGNFRVKEVRNFFR